MSDKLKKILVTGGIITILVIAVVLFILSARIHYNPDNAVGNTAGNLYNDGKFCEYNGRIYFANPYDYDRLYSMNPDCTDIKKLNVDSVSSINAYGNYLYYIRNNSKQNSQALIFRGIILGVIRTDLNGKKSASLYGSAAGVINLYGNNLYYQRYSKEKPLAFHKVSIDGREDVKISDAGIYPASIYNGKLYYVNTVGDHNIYTYDFTNGLSQIYMQANAYMVDMQGDYIYYIDLSDNYSLVRVNTTTSERTVLVDGTNGRCITYNIYNNSLFYHIEGKEAGLYHMNIDGSDNKFLKGGDISNISCTSQYTFFQIYNDPSLYRVPTSGLPFVEYVNIQ